MATSYANTGGTGDRTSFITVTSNLPINVGTYDNMLDGVINFGSADSWVISGNPANSGSYMKFDFGSQNVGKVIIDEAKWYQNPAADHGTWQWQGSDDNSSWTNIGSSFVLGNNITPVQTQTSLSGNTTGYRYYRLNGVSGNASPSSWNEEIEFKIDGWASPSPFVQVAGEATLVLVDTPGAAKVQQVSILLLTSTPPPAQVGQVAVLFLTRVKHRRVLTHFDVGS